MGNIYYRPSGVIVEKKNPLAVYGLHTAKGKGCEKTRNGETI